jgi:4-hydroxybenzoate polyprenyltransferase
LSNNAVSVPSENTLIPLCVDLDGTLTPVDTLHESVLTLVRHSPASLLSLPAWISAGKAQFKREIANRVDLDGAALPIRTELLEWLKAERSSGRPLVLVTAADRKIADSVATHLGVFDEVIASDGTDNLSGDHKRAILVERYGERGFDYVGNEAKDERVWKSARRAIVVGSPGLSERASKVTEVARVFTPASASVKSWLKAARLHQWVKNALIFLPLLLAHQLLNKEAVLNAAIAFLSFGLCASSVYIVNDLFDLAADRAHPRKRLRPFAAGALSARSGVLAAALLLGSSIALAISVNWFFCGALALYYTLTWAYSLRLKRAALVDVMTLAGLYTMRIIAGSAATMIEPSFWLLAFSIFIFLSLGCVKRYTELYDAQQAGKIKPHGRGYWPTDLPLILTLGTSAGYCTILVMALYLNSPESMTLYKHSKPLWLICPLLMYWISRVWLLATRGQMHDDPVVFALRDRISLAVLGLIGVIVLVAI